MMRIRKNIDCLSVDELHALREAYQALYDLPDDDPNSYHALASLHGGPPVVPAGPDGYCIHWSPGFLTWHRAYLLAFEDALRRIDCDVTLPYWDWSSGPTQGIPQACRQPTYVNRDGDTVPNPLYAAPKPGGGTTSRGPNADTVDFSGPAAQAQAALQANDFVSFQSDVYGPHGTVHVYVGGDMGSVPTAGFDPLFWMHHCNVDRLWARWSADHTQTLPGSEASLQLDPFNRPYTQQWRTGAEMASTTELGYRYRTLCFYLPPHLDLPILIDHRPWLPSLKSFRLVVHGERMQSQAMLMEVRVGDEEGAKTVLAGHLGFMGHPHAARGERPREAVVEMKARDAPEHDDGHDHGGHSHDHGPGAHGYDHGDVESTGGVMLVRPRQDTQGARATHTAHATHATHAADPARDFSKSVELIHALREVDGQKGPLALHVRVRDAEGRPVKDEAFHRTRLELVAD